MKPNVEERVAVYCRLSNEDSRNYRESRSITNQREFGTDYAKQNGWLVVEEYVDDGFTGSDFNRPDFQRMETDIVEGRVNCVIVKDLSRFSRCASEMEHKLLHWHKEYKIRFIAISDNIDARSANDYNFLFRVKISYNEHMVQDTSRKIRDAWVQGVSKGKMMFGTPPFGYIRGSQNKYRYEIDPEAAKIVQRIYREYSKGFNMRAIAEGLNKEGIDSPRAYYYANNGRKNPLDEKNYWNSNTIRQIIENEAYIGTLVQGKRRAVSYKDHDREQIHPDEWYRTENAHEAIIEADLWEQVRERRNSTKREKHSKCPFNKRTKQGHMGIFSGLLRCGDCGSALAYTTAGNTYIYRCSGYNNKGRTACTPHRIAEATLNDIVMHDINHYAQLAAVDRNALIQKVMDQVQARQNGDSAVLRNKRDSIISHIDKNSENSKALFEEKVVGNIPDNLFKAMMHDYSEERGRLERELNDIEHRLRKVKKAESGIEEWLSTVEQYCELTSVDRIVATELIESIVVHEQKAPDDKRVLNITIHYRFVGDLPSSAEKDIA